MSEENVVETQVENQDSQNTGEELKLEAPKAEETKVEVTGNQNGETPEQKIARLEEANRKLYARLKKEGEKKPEVVKNDTNSEGNIELIEFFAKGNSREDYNRLQVIMKGSGLSLDEAQKDPLYVAYKEDKARKERDEKAQIGASKGSSSGDNNGFKPNMSREEHKEAWKKANQK